ncbi:MAG: FAD-dependent thymidylate synthase [Polyangiaceae bacterium]
MAIAIDMSTAEPDPRAKISPFVSNLDKDVFAVFGLPEEVIAVLFAYYSRSRDDLRTNLAKLIQDDELALGETQSNSNNGLAKPALAAEKARAFHEKWVVGYGHGSVAEHAVVHLAVENVSILASKVIEDLRLGSYTEKSTRYVAFDADSYVDLPQLPASLRRVYRDACSNLFRVYLDLIPKVEAGLKQRVPRAEGQTVRAYDTAIRAQAFDLLRGLLPASTRTNLGLTANARALEHLLSKMLSHPIDEVRSVGESMLTEARTVTPTLVKYASASAFRATLSKQVEPSLHGLAIRRDHESEAVPVRLLRHDADALERIVLALAFQDEQLAVDAESLVADLPRQDIAALEEVIRAAVSQRGKWDAPPRAFEATSYTFELTVDYGAYRDLQRHRLLTPFPRRLGCELGADIPPELAELGVEEPFRAALETSRRAWEQLRDHDPEIAQYAVPLAYRMKVLWTMNLRELFHVVELRSAKQGHRSYRKIAQELYRTACEGHPWLAPLMRVDLEMHELARS